MTVATSFRQVTARAFLFSGGMGCAIGALIAATPVLAQEAPPAVSAPPGQADADGTAGDIVVTGIRGSIASSAAQKRDAVGILDAISSEDLGKFPDANVA